MHIVKDRIDFCFDEYLTCLLKTATSSLKESDEQTSPPATPGSRGVHVASSHFSNINANRGKSGCLQVVRNERDKNTVTLKKISKVNIYAPS